jgi:hypothetical protein
VPSIGTDFAAVILITVNSQNKWSVKQSQLAINCDTSAVCIVVSESRFRWHNIEEKG